MMIGLMGAKRAGKDTVCQMLQKIAPEVIDHRAFATKLKEMAYDLNGLLAITHVEAEGMMGRSQWLGHYHDGPPFPFYDDWSKSTAMVKARYLVDAFGWDDVKNTDAGRHYLQDLGMVLRAAEPDFWIHQLDHQLANEGLHSEMGGGRRVVVITDVRFANEISYVRKNGGELWRINRPQVEDGDPHPSEREWRGAHPHRILDNSTTLEALVKQVDHAWWDGREDSAP